MFLTAMGEDVWIGSAVGLYRFNTATRTMEMKNPLHAVGEVTSMAAIDNHRLLIGSSNGLWQYDTRSGLQSAQPQYFGAKKFSTITQLQVSSDNSLLVLTPSSLVCYTLPKESSEIKTERISTAQHEENPVNVVWPVGEGSKLWVGTDSGLRVFDEATAQTSAPIGQLKEDVAVTSLAMRQDELWIATRYRGLFRYATKSGKLAEYNYDENKPYSVVSNSINEIYNTRQDELFVLTNWGLCKYNPANDNFLTLPEIDSNISFLAMAEDSRGWLWTATANNGLLVRRAAGMRFEVFRGRVASSTPVSIMLLDSKGTFWVATQDNTVMYYDEQQEAFLRVDVPLTEIYPIIFMQDDADGNVWIGTQDGLMKIDTGKNLSYHFFKTDAPSIYSINPACRTADGRIFFGQAGSISHFNPQSISELPNTSHTFLHSISFPYSDDNNQLRRELGLDAALYTFDRIEIPFAHNTFVLHFSASHMSDMPAVIYEYKLEGVDKNWLRTREPEAAYANLQPGTYQFLLRPCFGSDAEVQRLKIVILPPWYLSTWACVVYLLLLLTAIVAIVAYSRSRVITQYKLRMDEMRVQKERETYESKMRFFVNLVHEIRTPLTLINIPLEQMAEQSSTQEAENSAQRKHIESMQRNVGYLLNITNQLLDFRKAEHDSEVKLVYSRINVSEWLGEICRRFEHPMEINGKTIVCRLPEEGLTATIDTEKLGRVVMNLIGNAMKFASSRVEVSLIPCANGATTAEALSPTPPRTFSILVCDDGAGLPPDKREHIFEAYYQIEDDNMAISLGTGLGLAYAQLIARAHGGLIKVEDGDCQMTTFRMTLPVGEDVSVAEHAELLRTEPANLAAANNFTILFVDDNAELLATVSEALAKHNNVITANDGQAALEILQHSEGIDMIISDFMMPRIDGAELCRRVKADVSTSHIPFILLTAKTGIEAKEEGMESGADVYIEKPFSIKQLNLQINNLLRTREQNHARMQTATATEGEGQASAPALNVVDAKFVEQMNALLLKNISDEEFSIDELAEQVGMSRSTFYRKIKALFGLTPIDYLKNFRLDHSAQLLRNGLRVSEAAMLSGFTSPSYFAKCFKAKFGVSPKEFCA